jgi:hypothetical protein
VKLRDLARVDQRALENFVFTAGGKCVNVVLGKGEKI